MFNEETQRPNNRDVYYSGKTNASYYKQYNNEVIYSETCKINKLRLITNNRRNGNITIYKIVSQFNTQSHT